jgi:hypothetical protein
MLGKETFGLNKGEFADKFSRIVSAYRAGSKLIGQPRDFIITACRLADRFSKVANGGNGYKFTHQLHCIGLSAKTRECYFNYQAGVLTNIEERASQRY